MLFRDFFILFAAFHINIRGDHDHPMHRFKKVERLERVMKFMTCSGITEKVHERQWVKGPHLWKGRACTNHEKPEYIDEFRYNKYDLRHHAYLPARCIGDPVPKGKTAVRGKKAIKVDLKRYTSGMVNYRSAETILNIPGRPFRRVSERP